VSEPKTSVASTKTYRKSNTTSVKVNRMSSKVAKLDFGGNIEETEGDSRQELSKIEKVEARLVELESGERRSNPEKEYELCKKEEKLRQKLRYLQFFAEYQVSPVFPTFCCSYCKDGGDQESHLISRL